MVLLAEGQMTRDLRELIDGNPRLSPEQKAQLANDRKTMSMYEKSGMNALMSSDASVAFVTKDSGARESLANGMVRDTAEGKIDYTLVLDGPLHRRYAGLLTRGAVKYGKRNWCKAFDAPVGADRDATIARFRESATRHFFQWLEGDRTEDHAAAVIFNMNGYEAMTTGEKH
jgi:hypothetical protein